MKFYILFCFYIYIGLKNTKGTHIMVSWLSNNSNAQFSNRINLFDNTKKQKFENLFYFKKSETSLFQNNTFFNNDLKGLLLNFEVSQLNEFGGISIVEAKKPGVQQATKPAETQSTNPSTPQRPTFESPEEIVEYYTQDGSTGEIVRGTDNNVEYVKITKNIENGKIVYKYNPTTGDLQSQITYTKDQDNNTQIVVKNYPH